MYMVGFACSRTGQVITPFKGNISPEQQDWNTKMNSARISIEWFFAIIKNSSRILYRAELLNICSRPIDVIFWNAVLISNLKTCMRRRNQISDYFDCPTISIDSYIHNMN